MENYILKDMIVATFHEMSNERGIRGITIEMLARKCRISKKTIYKYFSSKDEIIHTIADTILGEFQDAFSDIDAHVVDPLVKLHRLTELPFRFLGNISSLLLQDINQLYPEIELKINSIRDTYREGFIRNFNEGIKAGCFKDINPAFVSSFIAGAGERVLNSEFILKNNLTLIDAMSSFQSLLLSGLVDGGGDPDRK